jgi:hypothetical protein
LYEGREIYEELNFPVQILTESEYTYKVRYFVRLLLDNPELLCAAMHEKCSPLTGLLTRL